MKGAVLNKNLRTATAITNQQKSLIDATADLGVAKIGYQDRARLYALEIGLKQQEMEMKTGIAEGELREVEALQAIESHKQTKLLEQESVSPRSASDTVGAAMDRAEGKTRAYMDIQNSGEEFRAKLEKEGRPPEEIEGCVEMYKMELMQEIFGDE